MDDINIDKIDEIENEIFKKVSNGVYIKYYGYKEAFLSVIACCKIRKSYGVFKDALEKIRRFKKDEELLKQEIDITRIITSKI